VFTLRARFSISIDPEDFEELEDMPLLRYEPTDVFRRLRMRASKHRGTRRQTYGINRSVALAVAAEVAHITAKIVTTKATLSISNPGGSSDNNSSLMSRVHSTAVGILSRSVQQLGVSRDIPTKLNYSNFLRWMRSGLLRSTSQLVSSFAC
jgi:hypothetical protein